MDVNILREAATVLCFAAFAGILAWTWSRGNRARFEEAARLPFTQD